MEWQFVNAYFGRCHKSASTIFEISGNDWENDEHAMAWMRYDFIYCILCVYVLVFLSNASASSSSSSSSSLLLSFISSSFWSSQRNESHVLTTHNSICVRLIEHEHWTLNGISQAYTNDFVKFGWCNILIVVFNGQGNAARIRITTRALARLYTLAMVYYAYAFACPCECCLCNICIVVKLLSENDEFATVHMVSLLKTLYKLVWIFASAAFGECVPKEKLLR